jgi:hypothetical protein
MPKAVFRNGMVCLLEPVPSEWQEGQELRVESLEPAVIAEPMPEQIDHDFQELEALCAAGDDVEDAHLEQALAEAHRLAKEHVRQQMGRP